MQRVGLSMGATRPRSRLSRRRAASIGDVRDDRHSPATWAATRPPSYGRVRAVSERSSGAGPGRSVASFLAPPHPRRPPRWPRGDRARRNGRSALQQLETVIAAPARVRRKHERVQLGQPARDQREGPRASRWFRAIACKPFLTMVRMRTRRSRFDEHAQIARRRIGDPDHRKAVVLPGAGTAWFRSACPALPVVPNLPASRQKAEKSDARGRSSPRSPRQARRGCGNRA